MNTKKVADLPIVNINDLSILERKATLAAVEARSKAHARYSKFKVGAAVISVSGKIYTGVNIENHIYIGGIHAEVFACYIMAKDQGEECKFETLICAGECSGVPCGACLQITREFTGPDLNAVTVIGVNVDDTNKVIRCTFAEAMAVIDAFGPENLGY